LPNPSKEEEYIMAVVDYQLEGSVALLRMNDGENRFNPTFIKAFLDTLDEIEKHTNASALVVTSSHDKIFSNGIDLDWLLPAIKSGDLETSKGFFYSMMALFKRMLLYPMPTIAAISGHAFAGGAIFCCAFDFRFMRSDRGYFCFPEVDLSIPFLPGMLALNTRAIPYYMFEEMQLTGKRLTAQECERHHIVIKACSREELLGEALSFARAFNKRREIVSEMKKRLHKTIIHAMDVEDPPMIESGVFAV
jgi:enoyl-CoA hydratase/carnithine racemase